MTLLPVLSLRLRLTLLWSAVCLVVLLGLEIVTLAVLIAQVNRTTDRDLALEARRYQQAVTGATNTSELVSRANAYLGGDSDAGQGFAALYWIRFDGGPVLVNTADVNLQRTIATASLEPSQPTTVHDPRHGDLRMAAIPIEQDGRRIGEFRLAMPLTSVQSMIDDLLIPLLLANVALVAIGGVLAYLLTGTALAPVRTITAAAAGISERELGRRIGYQGPRDEAGILADTFDAMLARLQRGFEQRQAFYALASHEMRTPLTIVRGHLDVLRRSRDPEAGEVRETLDIALEELDRVTEQITDMLLLGRMLLGQRGPLELVDAAAVLRDIHRKARGLAVRRWEVVTPATVMIRADTEQLTRALLNLVTNAIRHTRDGDRVRLRCGTARDWAWIEVSDTGKGIRPDDLPNVFDPWYRASQDDAGVGGLGLMIVHEVARVHGGRVEVSSGDGSGTTFTLRLPLPAPGRQSTSETGPSRGTPEPLTLH